MSKKKKTLLALLVVAVVAVAVVAYLKSQPIVNDAGEYVVTDEPQFPTATLTLSKDGQTDLYRKDGESWIWDGHEGAALIQKDLSQMEAFLKDLTAQEIVSEHRSREEDQYGLTSGVTLTLADADGAAVSVVLGEVDGVYYCARAEGQDIFRLAPEVGQSLDRSSDDLRDRQLPFVDLEKMTALTVEHRDGDRFTVLAQKNGYVLTGAYKTDLPVKTDVLEGQIFPALEGLRILEFFDEASAQDCGLTEAELSLMVADEQREVTLLIGKLESEGVRYACLEGQEGIFTLSEEVLSPIETCQAFDLIEHQLVTTPAEDLARIEVMREDGQADTILMTKTDGSVQYSLNGRALSASDFSEFYKQLSALTRDEEVPERISVADGATPAVTVRLTSQDGEVRTLRFFDYNQTYDLLDDQQDREFFTAKKTVELLLYTIDALK
ncbi:MAG TPA: DUF4340 domain-containing protein [Firmicutes bacterium]|nr:DUF4340 domain-containing protein [Bacillota bacterium]